MIRGTFELLVWCHSIHPLIHTGFIHFVQRLAKCRVTVVEQLDGVFQSFVFQLHFVDCSIQLIAFPPKLLFLLCSLQKKHRVVIQSDCVVLWEKKNQTIVCFNTAECVQTFVM